MMESKRHNFWLDLPRPFYTLAPMEDVTDTVFRELIMGISDENYLHAVFAEFTSTDGLLHPVGRDNVIHRLHISDTERQILKKKNIKIIAQIWGSDPEKYYRSAKLISEEMDFDGIDINMGCPVKKIVKHISCSQLIKYPELAKEIIAATKEGSSVPVSVKTRTGVERHITEEWMSHLIEAKPACITLHCRTQKMMSDYPAVWAEMGKAIATLKKNEAQIPIIGNGDLLSIDDCHQKFDEYKADGYMIGRGIFKNPWIFNSPQIERTPEEKLGLLWNHVSLFLKTWKGRKNFPILKRFFKIYTYDFYGASEIRQKLMLTESSEDVYKILQETGYDFENQ
ncbi:MAG: tRNA-dihydrouridine synthase [Candidatus Kapabacteria bacterium]|nr:tRNA-dihydrouridine synthase [Candidatus Kapabacteria bacterium]